MNKIGIIIVVIIVLLGLGFFFFNDSGDTDSTDGETAMEETFSVTIRNLDDVQPLSPGVYVVHTDELSLDYSGTTSPAALESLAEYGSNAAFANYVRTEAGVVDVITVDAPILPGEEMTFTFDVDVSENPLTELSFSGIQMLVATNDAYALVDSISLSDVADQPEGISVQARNYDNGTEENEEPGGGFDAGQPDPDRGEENVENGTPTDPQEAVASHTQVTTSVLELEIRAEIDNEDEEGDDDTNDEEDSDTDESEEDSDTN